MKQWTDKARVDCVGLRGAIRLVLVGMTMGVTCVERPVGDEDRKLFATRVGQNWHLKWL